MVEEVEEVEADQEKRVCLRRVDTSTTSITSTASTSLLLAARFGASGYDWFRYPRALSRPTLVSYPERDPARVTAARDLVTNLPRASPALMLGAGHPPFLEISDHFFTLVETF